MLLPGGDAGAPSVYPGECVGVPTLFLVGLAIELSSWHELEQGNCVTGNDELTVTRWYRRSDDETGFGQAGGISSAGRQLRQGGRRHPLCDVGGVSVSNQPSLGVHTAAQRPHVGRANCLCRWSQTQVCPSPVNDPWPAGSWMLGGGQFSTSAFTRFGSIRRHEQPQAPVRS